MRPLTIYPASLVLGLVLAATAFLAMGQSTVPTPLRVEYVPHPRDMVQIKEGTPYVVPAGKLFVLTGLGSTGRGTNCPFAPGYKDAWLTVDSGTNSSPCIAQVSSVFCGLGVATVSSVPPGFSVVAGSMIQVFTVNCCGGGGSDSGGRAWGYLVNQ